jgi:1-phosphofructokinase family hexose kinase
MAGNILVVSLNPAIDCEWEVQRVQWEEKNNILRERRWAGGKGSNVARWLRQLGGVAELLVPLGGDTGKELARHLAMAKVRTRVVAVKEATRVNVIVTARRGGQIRFNPLGPMISPTEWRMIVAEIKRRRRGTVIFSGALPRGVPANAYETLIRIVRELGAEPILDCDGPAFAAGIEAQPALVKPNEHELERWWGKQLRTRRELFEAVSTLSEMTGGWVVVSRGAEGAVVWNSQMRIGFSAHAPKIKIMNTVGAGDALLAAVVRRKQMGAAPEEWLRWGVATGSAAAACEGGVLAKLETIRKLAAQIRVARFP